MAIPDGDMKVLWGRAAGICSNPICRADLTILLESRSVFNVGEMAHIIARSEDGPRGIIGGGTNNYDNLILLCPTCHRKIDKAPDGEYTEVMLHEWKSNHETCIRTSGKERIFDSFEGLKRYIRPLMFENRSLSKTFGPNSEAANSDPTSNLQTVWTLRKIDKVVPNNKKIENAIQANIELLDPEALDAFMDFKMHATAFEQHQYNRLDTYPTFPKCFEEIFA